MQRKKAYTIDGMKSGVICCCVAVFSVAIFVLVSLCIGYEGDDGGIGTTGCCHHKQCLWSSH